MFSSSDLQDVIGNDEAHDFSTIRLFTYTHNLVIREPPIPSDWSPVPYSGLALFDSVSKQMTCTTKSVSQENRHREGEGLN